MAGHWDNYEAKNIGVSWSTLLDFLSSTLILASQHGCVTTTPKLEASTIIINLI